MRLLKADAQERNTSVKEVLLTALEAYFAPHPGTNALAGLSERTFTEWDDPRDSAYDRM